MFLTLVSNALAYRDSLKDGGTWGTLPYFYHDLGEPVMRIKGCGTRSWLASIQIWGKSGKTSGVIGKETSNCREVNLESGFTRTGECIVKIIQ